MQNFTGLSDLELETQFRGIVFRERTLLQCVLEHIREIDRRKLFLKRARPSLFDYLIEDFGYSPAAAQRRIEAARLSVQMPEVLEKVGQGALSLTQISTFQKAIRQKEKSSEVPLELKRQILDKIQSSSHREAEKIVSEMLNLSLVKKTSTHEQRDGSFRIALTLSAESWMRLQRCRELLGHVESDRGIPGVVHEICGYFLERRDPLLRTVTSAAEVTPQHLYGPVSAKVRRFVFQRDKVCQYKDPRTHRLCGSSFQLEVDHIRMRCDGGSNEPENLRVLCRQHNQFLAMEALRTAAQFDKTAQSACPSP